jgi:hypothetical protein
MDALVDELRGGAFRESIERRFRRELITARRIERPALLTRKSTVPWSARIFLATASIAGRVHGIRQNAPATKQRKTTIASGRRANNLKRRAGFG